jgi:Ca2+-binding RTX toxin-like protein
MGRASNAPGAGLLVAQRAVGAGGQAQPAVVAALGVHNGRLAWIDAYNGAHFTDRGGFAGGANLAAGLFDRWEVQAGGHWFDFTSFRPRAPGANL